MEVRSTIGDSRAEIVNANFSEIKQTIDTITSDPIHSLNETNLIDENKMLTMRHSPLGVKDIVDFFIYTQYSSLIIHRIN